MSSWNLYEGGFYQLSNRQFVAGYTLGVDQGFGFHEVMKDNIPLADIRAMGMQKGPVLGTFGKYTVLLYSGNMIALSFRNIMELVENDECHAYEFDRSGHLSKVSIWLDDERGFSDPAPKLSIEIDGRYHSRCVDVEAEKKFLKSLLD